MHFLLFGATGRTGQHVVSQLLAQGHTAIALVRNPASLAARNGLTIVIGSPLSAADVKSALLATATKPTAAIFTLNTVRESDSPFAAQVSPPRFLADSCAVACKALEDEGIRRIVVMSTAGAGSSWGGLPLLSKAFMRWTNVKYALEDHDLLDEEIRRTNMDWTLVRPVKLEFEAGEGAAVQTLGDGGKGMKLSDSANVVSVAKFLVKTAVEGLYVKDAVVVRN
ncbi:hypothetical protein VHEMI10246 [[Torrubiella] hemipterigena]|uniref:NAD(P)-binding domain-containing protein n=1 Tax=[Torrubiella] hemipterigena TaxID=1531966 RepID=A0A0A1TRK4_9HYPO|nr:hypothetical protein VHEMI10246 [[Torrubiella] hemipterigena]